ncbi:hypothetical protein [Aeromicrobium sp. Leaf350]|uniref:hypothetical protein n=1 Tax=Aeromicrobium sp. Leaf350 TaxID=2876565 RepID=UPI001E3A2DD2|nr:hypothetical protein [Aeromicrobium sp. Leaf350]
MRVWIVRGLLVVVLSVLLVYAVAGSSRISGPVLFTLVENRHGVHVGDVVAFVTWCVGLGAVARVK